MKTLFILASALVLAVVPTLKASEAMCCDCCTTGVCECASCTCCDCATCEACN